MAKSRKPVKHDTSNGWICSCGTPLVGPFKCCPFDYAPLPVTHAALRNPKPKKERKP